MKKIIAIIVLVIVIGAIYLNSRLLSSGDDYRPDKSAISALQNKSIEKVADQIRFGDAFRKSDQGNIVIHLHGSPYEMGYQQGLLLKEEIINGTVFKFADPIANSRSYESKNALIKWAMLKFLEFKVYAPIEESTPIEYLQEIAGIADGAGIPYEVAFRGSFLSDMTMNMLPGMIKEKLAELGLKLECSDFVVTGKVSKDGSLLVGRNTDYGGQGLWGKNQVIVYYHPSSGNRYVKVSTAGLLKCNSAMNEKGITVGGHFMGFEGAKPAGYSFTILENEIMRKASTLDEALSIIKSAPRSGSFSLMLSDGNSEEAAVVEAAGDHIGIRKMKNDSIVLTNYATTDEMKKYDLMARYNLVMRDMRGRYLRLEQLIEENSGKITPEMAATFLGDHIDINTGEERTTGITVCAANNVTSAVFQPSTGKFWVATGKEPACGNTYFPYSLSGEAENMTQLAGYQWQNPDKQKALEFYMQAFIAYLQSSENDQKVMTLLKKAIALDSNESIYHLLLGRLFLLQGDYSEALSYFDQATSFSNSNNETAVLHLFKGFTLDLMKSRNEAVVNYSKITDLVDEYGYDYMKGINRMVAGFATKFQSESFSEDLLSSIPFSFGTEGGIE